MDDAVRAPTTERALAWAGMAGLIVGVSVAAVMSLSPAGDPMHPGDIASMGLIAGLAVTVFGGCHALWYVWLVSRFPAAAEPRGAWRYRLTCALTLPFTLVASLVATAIVTLPAAAFVGWVIEPALEEPFDQGRWAQRVDFRRRMAQELIQSRRLVGMTVAQVVALLGPPRSRADSVLMYSTGELGGVPPSPCELTIRMRDGRAVTVEHDCRD